MRRAERLFEILQVLRRAKRPMTARQIGERVETSQRSVYRDIAVLVAQGVPVRGEAGVGYVLERGFDLPPLMFTSTELDAVVLGARWVVANGDASLSEAADDVLAKVEAVVPRALRAQVDEPVVATPGSRAQRSETPVDLVRLRDWTRRERSVWIRYVDATGSVSERTVWPVLVGYMEQTRALVAWCELRADFRVFRVDRVLAIAFLDNPYPASRRVLRRRWEDRVGSESGSS